MDWAVNKAGSGSDWLANQVKDVPVLGTMAQWGSSAFKCYMEFEGGIAKGALGLVSGLAGMVANPLGVVKGLESMAEHIPGPAGALLKLGHGALDAATGKKSWGDAVNDALDPTKSLADDAAFWKTMGGAFLKPYTEAWEQGKYFEVAGRASFEIALLVATGGESAAAKGGSATAKMAEAAEVVNTAGKATEVASLAGKTAEVGNVASKTAEGAGLVSKAEEGLNLASKVEDGANLAGKVEEGGGLVGRAPGTTTGEAAGSVPKIEDALFKKGDPAFDKYGAATKSHPEEYAKLMKDLEKQGVKVVERPDGLAYSPSSTPGVPGEIYLDPEASFSAVTHEHQHFMDDAARGFPGKEALFQPNTRWEMEAAAYGKEIALARRSGDLDLVRQLELLRTEEWRRIYMPHLGK